MDRNIACGITGLAVARNIQPAKGRSKFGATFERSLFFSI
jgi:hypothetical protein